MISYSVRKLVAVTIILSLQFMLALYTVKRSVAFTKPATSGLAIQKYREVEARRIWELAVAAKGGRERLYSVRNMVISGSEYYLTRKGKKNEVRHEELYVFPNKYWWWEDYGSDVFGTRMHMYNYDLGMQYVGAPGSTETRLEPVTPRSKVPGLNNAPIFLLLETQWLKPTPVRSSSESIDGNGVDVVETTIDNRRVDYAFDQKTHLPTRVSFYNTLNNRTWTHVLRLADYIQINGIQVPQTIAIESEGGGAERITVRFNVTYNDEIFAKPTLERAAGPQAWRAKSE